MLSQVRLALRSEDSASRLTVLLLLKLLKLLDALLQ
jgi:hypothetical protein